MVEMPVGMGIVFMLVEAIRAFIPKEKLDLDGRRVLALVFVVSAAVVLAVVPFANPREYWETVFQLFAQTVFSNELLTIATGRQPVKALLAKLP